MITLLNLIIIAYLTGSILNAIVVCRIAKLPDPRQQGSGNPGMTNVLRFTNIKIASVVLLLDASKGILPVFLGQCLGLNSLALLSICCAAVLGHVYPVFFNFKGGKGVATFFGGILVCSPAVGLLCLATWAAAAGIWRYASLAALITVALLPIYVGFLLNIQAAALSLALTMLLFLTHRENIVRLKQGLEKPLFKEV